MATRGPAGPGVQHTPFLLAPAASCGPTDPHLPGHAWSNEDAIDEPWLQQWMSQYNFIGTGTCRSTAPEVCLSPAFSVPLMHPFGVSVSPGPICRPPPSPAAHVVVHHHATALPPRATKDSIDSAPPNNALPTHACTCEGALVSRRSRREQTVYCIRKLPTKCTGHCVKSHTLPPRHYQVEAARGCLHT